MPVDCREWITCLQQGEEKALEHFFETYHRGIYDFSLRIVQDKDDAADIAQECFLKLWASRQSINDETHVRNLLYLDARRLSLMCLRRRNQKLQRDGEFNYLSIIHNDGATPDPGMEVPMTGYGSLHLLYTDIEQLPPCCREVFKLYFFEKKTTKEIAAQLQLSPQTVLNQKTRARNRLRQLFQKREMTPLIFLLFLWLFH